VGLRAGFCDANARDLRNMRRLIGTSGAGNYETQQCSFHDAQREASISYVVNPEHDFDHSFVLEYKNEVTIKTLQGITQSVSFRARIWRIAGSVDFNNLCLAVANPHATFCLAFFPSA